MLIKSAMRENWECIFSNQFLYFFHEFFPFLNILYFKILGQKLYISAWIFIMNMKYLYLLMNNFQKKRLDRILIVGLLNYVTSIRFWHSNSPKAIFQMVFVRFFFNFSIQYCPQMYYCIAIQTHDAFILNVWWFM